MELSLIGIKPRHLTLLFASLSLGILFITETYHFISAIKNGGITEEQRQEQLSRIKEIQTRARAEKSRQDYMTHFDRIQTRDRAEKSREDYMAANIEDNNGDVLTQHGENGEMADFTVLDREMNNDEFMGQDGEKSSGVLIDDGHMVNDIQSMDQNSDVFSRQAGIDISDQTMHQDDRRQNDGDMTQGLQAINGFIAPDDENTRGELTNLAHEESTQFMDQDGNAFIEEGRGDEFHQMTDQDSERPDAEAIAEARNSEFMSQEGGKPIDGLITTDIQEVSVNPMVQDVVNEYPYNLLRDIQDHSMNDKADGDIPIFWHIHKSGGSNMKHIFTCLRKVQTRRMNEPPVCSDQEPVLRICDLPFGTDNLGSRVINADISSINGIKRAIDLGLTTAGKFPSPLDCTNENEGGCTDQEFIIDTSRIYDALKVFTPARRGRLFMLLRHPVERAISKYFYIKVATWERNFKPQVANMTLFEYADSKLCYNNWVTRRLVNKMEGDLTLYDLEVAKEILRRKALVLLLDDMDGAITRLRSFFGWNMESLDEEQQNCLREFAHDNPINVNANKRDVVYGGPEWDAVKKKNLIDLELYIYAKELYKSQEQMIFQPFITDSNVL